MPGDRWTQEQSDLLASCVSVKDAMTRTGKSAHAIMFKRRRLGLPRWADERLYEEQAKLKKQAEKRAKNNSV